MDTQDKKFLSFSEGCEYLGYKPSYCYKMVQKGILPFLKPNGRKIFFDKEKLQAWMLGTLTNKKGGRNE